jgi:hypothetical protein
MITQLNPPLPLHTPQGKGWAHFLIDYSQEHDLLWVVFLNKNGECWTVPNSRVRMDTNYSLGRYDFSSSGTGIPSGEFPGEHRSVLGDRGDGQESRETATGGAPEASTGLPGDGPA